MHVSISKFDEVPREGLAAADDASGVKSLITCWRSCIFALKFASFAFRRLHLETNQKSGRCVHVWAYAIMCKLVEGCSFLWGSILRNALN